MIQLPNLHIVALAILSFTLNSPSFAIVGGKILTSSDDLAKRTVVVAKMPTNATRADYDLYGLCSGVLISPNKVLTAAHCVAYEAPDSIRVGFTITTEEKNINSYIQGKEILIHPSYNSENSMNDLAIIEIVKVAPNDYKTTPIISNLIEVKKSDQLILSGYGINDPKTGDDGILKSIEMSPYQISLITKELIFKNNGYGSCKGDSGGPAFLRVEGKLFIAGITSHGEQGYKCGQGYSYYSDLRKFSKWIRSLNK